MHSWCHSSRHSYHPTLYLCRFDVIEISQCCEIIVFEYMYICTYVYTCMYIMYACIITVHMYVRMFVRTCAYLRVEGNCCSFEWSRIGGNVQVMIRMYTCINM